MGKSVKDAFGGGYTHYDNNGKKIGRSEPGIFGGYTNYDSKGNKVGRSEESIFGGFNNYDNNGKKVSHTSKGILGDYTTTSKDGTSNTTTEGCYIATSVYGNYDCSEVWVLRRFRDEFLYEHKLGRIFIKCYYKISPKLVKIFGNKNWFKNICKKLLDKFVIKLKSIGYKDSPYNDRY